MAGVVDQDVDRDATVTQPLMQPDNCPDIGKINLLHHDLNAMLLANGLGDYLKPVQTARHQD
jgi:hypothetical protein